MDNKQFDELAKMVGEPTTRRFAFRSLGGSAFGAVLGLLGLADAEAGRKKGKKKKRRPQRTESCGPASCSSGTFCCDDGRGVCCAAGSSCCNLGPGTGSCCPSPNSCGKPWGNDAAPYECCPPQRQWFTSVGLIRCCPPGTRALKGITADDGPCCPEEKYCGDTCCPDLAPVCVNAASEQCCTAELACGTACCDPGEGCCNGVCKELAFDPVNCGVCGRACDPRTERCHEGQCRDRCSLNTIYRNRCDQGGDYWCCPDDSPVCCRDGDGDPHCCAH